MTLWQIRLIFNLCSTTQSNMLWVSTLCPIKCCYFVFGSSSAQFVSFSNVCISQGSVATFQVCTYSVGNFVSILAGRGFWKLVNFRQSYCQKQSGTFLWDTVHIAVPLCSCVITHACIILTAVLNECIWMTTLTLFTVFISYWYLTMVLVIWYYWATVDMFLLR